VLRIQVLDLRVRSQCYLAQFKQKVLLLQAASLLLQPSSTAPSAAAIQKLLYKGWRERER
jgi:hypothetical protein